MVVTIPTTPDEETALQDRKGVSATGGVILGANPEVVTLELPLSQDSRTPSIEGNADACGVSEAIEKTPLPWAQFSVLLFLQLAEPLTSNVIYPFYLSSLHLRSVRIPVYVCGSDKLTLRCAFIFKLIQSLNVTKDGTEVGYYVGILEEK